MSLRPPPSCHRHASPTPTHPVPLCLTGSCWQWEIYDEYLRDLERQRLDEAAKARGGKRQGAAGGGAGASHAPKSAENVPTLQSPVLSHCLGALDRMVNQNMFEEVAMDFKYWDDASDAFRCGGVGRLWNRGMAARRLELARVLVGTGGLRAGVWVRVRQRAVFGLRACGFLGLHRRNQTACGYDMTQRHGCGAPPAGGGWRLARGWCVSYPFHCASYMFTPCIPASSMKRRAWRQDKDRLCRTEALATPSTPLAVHSVHLCQEQLSKAQPAQHGYSPPCSQPMP